MIKMLASYLSTLGPNGHIREARQTSSRGKFKCNTFRHILIADLLLCCLSSRGSLAEVLATGRLEKCVADGETEVQKPLQALS
jgi:hypothetical protein